MKCFVQKEEVDTYRLTNIHTNKLIACNSDISYIISEANKIFIRQYFFGFLIQIYHNLRIGQVCLSELARFSKGQGVQSSP